MSKITALILWIIIPINHIFAQNTPPTENKYFPPISGEVWEKVDLDQLNWHQENMKKLYQFLENTNAKSFIILVDGKIAIEAYFNNQKPADQW